MTTFKDRLLSLFDTNTKPSHIAASIGMSIPGFMRIFNEGFIPKADGLIKIHQATGCDLTWLLTGKGRPFPDSNESQQIESLVQLDISPLPVLYDVLGRPVDINEFVFIPHYDITASAGNGYYNSNENNILVLAFRKYWITNYLQADPKQLSVIAVKGDSMEGVLNDGDTILVNHAKNKPDSGLYVVRIGDGLIVKRVQSLPGGRLLITSANEAYTSFEIDISSLESNDVSIIGRVEWFGRYI
jgi:phage repressor protein C with HTH and peptisase S24 domain